MTQNNIEKLISFAKSINNGRPNAVFTREQLLKEIERQQAYDVVIYDEVVLHVNNIPSFTYQAYTQ